ncbi:MAG: hypothetical protein PVI21_00810 [Candidatus Woesebacteria bacterium]|jgi:hypothetical protein
MSSKKISKKRNKAYRGKDAKSRAPVVHHYQAVQRSRFGEWWLEHKRQVKVISYIVGGVLIFSWLIYELVRLF